MFCLIWKCNKLFSYGQLFLTLLIRQYTLEEVYSNSSKQAFGIFYFFPFVLMSLTFYPQMYLKVTSHPQVTTVVSSASYLVHDLTTHSHQSCPEFRFLTGCDTPRRIILNEVPNKNFNESTIIEFMNCILQNTKSSLGTLGTATTAATQHNLCPATHLSTLP